MIPSEIKVHQHKACFHTSTLTSIENITKAVQRLPNYLRQTFYKHTGEIMETGVISLLEFDLWLGIRMKELFNPIVDIIVSQGPNRKKDPLKAINAGHISEREEVKCWFCFKKHKVTPCEDFISSSINVKNEFVKANKLCWNCLGKDNNKKHCQSKHRCKVANCNKRHHTLLHNAINVIIHHYITAASHHHQRPILHHQFIKDSQITQMTQSLLIISN